MQNEKSAKKSLPRRNLIAPLVMLCFALAWYRFSVVYIQRANSQLVQHGNLSVYVPLQQLNAYMAAVLDFTYVSVALALVYFVYFLARSIQNRRA